MTHEQKIIAFLERFPGKDDDEIAVGAGITPRQAVNQICRKLAIEGVIRRGPGPRGKIVNYPADKAGRLPLSAAITTTFLPAPPIVDATDEWFWEGNIVRLLAAAFERQGWEILEMADTMSKARGIDLRIRRDAVEVVIEVKGYPSTVYRDAGRAKETKPTAPLVQAGHWYSHALLKAMRLVSSHATARVALAFPDFPRYRTLYKETREALRRVEVALIFVAENGELDIDGL